MDFLQTVLSNSVRNFRMSESVFPLKDWKKPTMRSVALRMALTEATKHWKNFGKWEWKMSDSEWPYRIRMQKTWYRFTVYQTRWEWNLQLHPFTTVFILWKQKILSTTDLWLQRISKNLSTNYWIPIHRKSGSVRTLIMDWLTTFTGRSVFFPVTCLLIRFSLILMEM